MKQSNLFTKTRKEAPKDEVSKNAKFLIRAGYIHKEMAGVYDYMPLGLRVLERIKNVVREEMNSIGAQEILLTTLQDPEIWKKSGRWDDNVVDNWFKTKLVNGTEVGIANTHEEPLTNLLKHFVSSEKDLPVYAYQFQIKFRNEKRAKSGIMRGREFMMKDAYSFNKSEDEFKVFYEKCADAYMKIFERMGMGDLTYRTIAPGGSFTTGFTDEFQTITDSGEDLIYIDKDKNIAINKEVYSDENLEKFGMDKNNLVEASSVEVGNIFPLGTKYSDALGLKYKDASGKQHSIYMGSYGIGIGRLMGTAVEVLSDDKGIVWPKEIAPFDVHLVSLFKDIDDDVKKESDNLYKDMLDRGINVLYDDRKLRAGTKFADSDLLGIPTRIIVSERTVAEGGVEFVDRATGGIEFVRESNIIDKIQRL